MANAESWDFPVLLEVVRGATARRTVDGDARMLDDFVAGAKALVARGAVGVITSCGFLAVEQERLAARISVPVATSALLQIPMVSLCLPRGRGVGVITYDAASLTPAHFLAVGADPATPVAGLPRGGAFHAMIEGCAPYDEMAFTHEILTAADTLRAMHPQLGALVLECTNLPPFAARLRAHAGLAVYDIITLGSWFRAGLVERAFA